MISIHNYLRLKRISLYLCNVRGLTKLRLLVFVVIVISGINVLFLGQIHNSPKSSYSSKDINWKEWDLRVEVKSHSKLKDKYILGTSTTERKPGLVSKMTHKVSGFTDNFSMAVSHLKNYFLYWTSPGKKKCPVHTLSDSKTIVSSSEKIKCEPHQPSREACGFAAKLYPLDSSLLTCGFKGKGELCSVKVALVGENVVIDELYCSKDICDPQKPITSLHTNPVNGKTVTKSYESLLQLQKNLSKMIIAAIDSNLNYVFLKCTDLFGEEYSQLMSLPIKLKFSPVKKKRHAINVNLLWIDSVSRAHFYRSLPNTINAFKEIQQNDNIHAQVFDFELFQAIHGHTAENELALFTGKLTEKKLGEESNHAVHMDVMFNEFKKHGYQTMWMEDLCWEAVWGLSLDIDANSWSSLVKRLKKASIDFTGLTHSSCEILHSNGLETPFSGPNQICYNGEFQDTYHLKYNYNFFKAVSKIGKSQPLFSFTSLNAAHDHIGRRTQTLDLSLAQYAKLMASEEQTLTIIFSDHGNTYTKYTYGVLEGQFEMFHPAMFMIIPNKVASIVGKNVIQNLQENQKRLVTMLDLHPMLMSVARKAKISNVSTEVGIFSKIPANRTCDSVQLQTPNLCVCEGWDTPTTNDLRRRGLMEFAIGQLNNMLQNEMGDKVKLCQKLYALRFENVRERSAKHDGSLITSIDVVVKAGSVVDQKEDIFHLEVQTEQGLGETSLHMVLLNYDRHTLFGKYKRCAPKGVNLKLCICSIDNSGQPVIQDESWLDVKFIESLPWMYEQKTKITPISDDFDCLYILQRIHGSDDSKGFEVVNSCEKTKFEVDIQTQVDNMRFSGTSSFTVTVKPHSSSFLFSAVKHIHYWEASFSYVAKILSRREVK